MLVAQVTLLGACGGMVSDADIQVLQQEMLKTFAQRGQKVVDFKLTPDSSTQVSGTIHVAIEMQGSTRVFFTTCLARIDPSSRKWDWRCDSVP